MPDAVPPPAAEVMRSVEQQMLMQRPWHAAESDSLWEITGVYPDGQGTFTACLALVLPAYVTDGAVLFQLLGPVSLLSAPTFGVHVVRADQITSARPLILVHRDEPGTAYYERDQVWLRTGENL